MRIQSVIEVTHSQETLLSYKYLRTSLFFYIKFFLTARELCCSFEKTTVAKVMTDSVGDSSVTSVISVNKSVS